MTGRKDQLSVLLSGGFPWGFRLQGGAGTGLPLVVSKVRRKSKAYKRLCEGDLILSVNGKSCQNLTYDQVMEIADKSGTDLTLQVLRQESDKENLAPQLPASSEAVKEPLHSVTKLENGSLTNEVLSVKETSTKITKETEGMRIKSAVLLPDIDFAATDKILENFTSTKLLEDKGETAEKEVTSTEPFPPFSELLQTSQGPPKPPRSPIDLSTSSKTEEVSQDDNTYIKTTTERKHEVVGNKEISYVKQEQESVSKSSTSPVPDITLDTIDLNNLISATQKRLDSFKNGFAQETPTVSDALSSTYEIKKTEISSSTALTSESKTTEVTNSVDQSTDSTLQDIVVDFKKNDTGKKIPPPPPPKPKIRPLSESYAQTFKDCLKEMEMKSEEQIMSSTLPKPKVRPLSESFAENLKDCLKELETDLNATSGDTGFTSTSNESSYVTTESPFGVTTISKKKKMFSSSSFYEEPHSIYPTVEEQVEMARKIASSLADDTNKKSKGSNMFYKRVKRSSKWIHEGPDPSDESAPGTPEVQNIEPPTPDPSQVPFKPSKGPPKLKLVLDPRHPLDVQALRSSGYIISEHNVVSPEVCHDLVKDLQSPVGKGAALFAKRKKKSEEWVVDEEKVKTLLREQEKKSRVATPNPPFNQYSGIGRPEVKLVKTPWEAAMENPYGLCDAAFARVSPDELADTVIKAADNKRRNSITTNSREPSRLEGCISPPAHVTPAAAHYDIYHAKAPKGWSGTTPIVDNTAVTTSTAPVVSRNIQQDVRPNEYTPAKKMVFQNFNATPRLWKGTSAY